MWCLCHFQPLLWLHWQKSSYFFPNTTLCVTISPRPTVKREKRTLSKIDSESRIPKSLQHFFMWHSCFVCKNCFSWKICHKFKNYNLQSCCASKSFRLTNFTAESVAYICFNIYVFERSRDPTSRVKYPALKKKWILGRTCRTNKRNTGTAPGIATLVPTYLSLRKPLTRHISSKVKLLVKI